jgi:uncharacterized protein YciI
MGNEAKPLKHYLLAYEIGSDFTQKREAYRSEHLALAWEASSKGELLLAGVLEPPTATAVLLFQGQSSEVAERFARADPYVREGLVKKRRVRQWHTVAGPAASTPVGKPESKR